MLNATSQTRLWNGSAARWLKYRLGIVQADTQTTYAERQCLLRHATGKRSLVEIGVMHGVNTALLRSVMHTDGLITGIDPHPPGRHVLLSNNKNLHRSSCILVR